MISILTFNAGLLDVRVLGLPVHRPLPNVDERLNTLIAGLREIAADIVCLQEVYHRRHQRRLARQLHDLYPHCAGLRRHSVRLGCDLMILSRYPVLASRQIRFLRAMPEESLFTNRGLQEVSIGWPDFGRLRLVHLHTSAGGLFRHPESAPAEAIRMQQLDQALALAAGTPHDPVLLVGDFNAGPEASRFQYQRILGARYSDAFLVGGGQGISWDPSNPLVARGKEWHLPPQRIDHLFLNNRAAELLRPVDARIVFDEPRVRLAGGVRLPLSDHYGVLVRLRVG